MRLRDCAPGVWRCATVAGVPAKRGAVRPYGPLRGRDDVLATGLRVVRRTHNHRASGVVVVSGDPGIGKTAVLTEIARQAAHMRIRVARSKCDEIGQAHPGAPILSLLRAGQDPLIDAANFEALTELSGNQVLLDFVTQVDRRVRWYYTPIARQRGKTSWEEHAKLIDAIENGEADTASKIMREHTEHTRRSYLEQRNDERAAEEVADEVPAATPIRARRRRVAPPAR